MTKIIVIDLFRKPLAHNKTKPWTTGKKKKPGKR